MKEIKGPGANQGLFHFRAENCRRWTWVCKQEQTFEKNLKLPTNYGRMKRNKCSNRRLHHRKGKVYADSGEFIHPGKTEYFV